MVYTQVLSPTGDRTCPTWGAMPIAHLPLPVAFPIAGQCKKVLLQLPLRSQSLLALLEGKTMLKAIHHPSLLVAYLKLSVGAFMLRPSLC